MSAMKSALKPKVKSTRPTPSLSGSFTVRDLNRQPAQILRACDERGSVRIRTRDGRTYDLRAESAPETTTPSAGRQAAFDRYLQHRRMLKSLGAVSPGPEAADLIHRIIAGEV